MNRIRYFPFLRNAFDGYNSILQSRKMAATPDDSVSRFCEMLLTATIPFYDLA